MIPTRVALGAALLAVFSLYSPPAEPSLRLCGFLWLTGLPCPLCGMTRALCALAKGHWQTALSFHPLSPLAMAMLLAACFAPSRVSSRAWATSFALLLGYGVVRMFSL
jgi:hypothetical protein